MRDSAAISAARAERKEARASKRAVNRERKMKRHPYTKKEVVSVDGGKTFQIRIVDHADIKPEDKDENDCSSSEGSMDEFGNRRRSRVASMANMGINIFKKIRKKLGISSKKGEKETVLTTDTRDTRQSSGAFSDSSAANASNSNKAALEKLARDSTQDDRQTRQFASANEPPARGTNFMSLADLVGQDNRALENWANGKGGGQMSPNNNVASPPLTAQKIGYSPPPNKPPTTVAQKPAPPPGVDDGIMRPPSLHIVNPNLGPQQDTSPPEMYPGSLGYWDQLMLESTSNFTHSELEYLENVLLLPVCL